MDALGVDLLSLSSHKVYGPKGIGALFISGPVRSRMRPIIHGGGQEAGLRSGTHPTPLCVGFGAAARRLIERRARDTTHVAECRDSFLTTLRARVPDITLNGTEPKHPGQLNIRVSGVDAEDLVANVQPRLALSTGAACSSGIPEPSHVLRALGLNATAASQCIRVGFGRTSDTDTARDAAAILASTIEDIRSNSALARPVDAF